MTKRYPGTLANDDVSLTIEPGQIHALLGENGAGKSTLVKCVYGVTHADAGEIRWNGAPVTIPNPHAARALGIGMVFQHFSLFDAMTVEENIALGVSAALAKDNLRDRIRDVSAQYGLPLDPRQHVHALSVGEQQRIEIVRCLLQEPQLLVMDEPTSVLTPQEVEKLFVTLRRLASEGVSILYISHKLEEIRQLCHVATIMRGGKVVSACDPTKETAKSLAEMMIGDSLRRPVRTDGEKKADTSTEPLVSLQGLSVPAADQHSIALRDISLDIYPGEVLGIAGIAGNGQTEFMDALSGETPANRPDAVTVSGRPVGNAGPGRRRALGACFVPEDRYGHSAVAEMPLWENAFLTGFWRLGLARQGFIDQARSVAHAEEVVETFRVKTAGVSDHASSLSGGNLQKFVIGREILQKPDVLAVLQPTWGIDAGAAAAIHQAFMDMAARGAAVLVISQDLDELFAVCDRIAVMAGGRLSEPARTEDLTVERIGLLMGGIPDQANATH